MAEQICKYCGKAIKLAGPKYLEPDRWVHVDSRKYGCHTQAEPISEIDAQQRTAAPCSICGHPQHDMMCNHSLWCGSCNCPGEKQAAEWAARDRE